jgi:hypothetical protein
LLRRRVMTAAASLVLTIAGSLVAFQAPALAAGCRSAPYSGTISGQGVTPWQWFPDYNGAWNTTSQCSDINMKVTSVSLNTPLYACVVFNKYGDQCNHTTQVTVGSWQNIATDVLDNTKFRVVLWHNQGSSTDWVDAVFDF